MLRAAKGLHDAHKEVHDAVKGEAGKAAHSAGLGKLHDEFDKADSAAMKTCEDTVESVAKEEDKVFAKDGAKGEEKASE